MLTSPSRRVWVKICGIRSTEDAAAAVAAGADAIGLVFVPGSRRRIDVDQAAAICAALPPLILRVGLFMDAQPAAVSAVLQRVPLHVLQFHGDESAAYCRQWGRPWWKALPMAGLDAAGAAAMMASYPDADAWLLDGHAAGEQGGSGQRFDWSQVPAAAAERTILAGGLGPDNVAAALRLSGAASVDVSSGVESAPGCKNLSLMQRFVEEARRARPT